MDTYFFPITNIIAVINLKICCFHFSAIKVMIQMALQILIVVASSIKTKTNPVSAKNIFLNSVASVILFLLLDSWRL